MRRTFLEVVAEALKRPEDFAPISERLRLNMAIIIGFLVAIAFIGGLFYVLVIYREVPGAMEQRLGVLEALPEDLGKWKVDEDSEEGKAAMQQGQKREERLFFDMQSEQALRQVRFRNRATNEVTRTVPDEVVKRKRIRS